MKYKIKVFIYKEFQKVAALAMKATAAMKSSTKLRLKFRYLAIRCLKYS
jgi:hypothetical protein